MTILNASVGALRLSLAKGETLIVRNYSGVETVSGSTVSREDASSTLGAGAVVYGPQSVAASIVLSTTGTLDYQTVMGDPTPAHASVGVVGFSVIPPTRDSLGIEVAQSMCVAVGSGTVVYEAADYDLSADITLVKNVSHVGVKPRLVFDGDVPDAGFSTEGGTRFLLAAGVTGFKYNNTARGTEPADIAEDGISGVKIIGITFIGGKRAVDIGAYFAMGLIDGAVDELYAFDQTDDFAFNLVNFQHTRIGKLWTSTQLEYGSGIRLGAALSAALLPGNSTITDELYTYCKNRRNRSIVWEAFGPSGCVLNQMKNAGRMQGNRYGAATPDDIGMSFTSGSENIVVADNAQFALMVVDMPIVFPADTAGFAKTTVYYVRTRNSGTNTITLAETRYATSDIVATATTTGTAKCSGFPSLEVIGRAGCAISHGDLGLIDAEAYGNVCAVSIEKTRYCVGYLAEIMTSATGTALACRDVVQGLTYGGQASLTQDESSLFGQVNVRNEAGGPFPYSGGDLVLDATWNDRDVRYTGTANITITVPNNLPKGFKFSITPTGTAGRVTFLNSAGGAIFSTSGLVTVSRYSTARLENIANRVFVLEITAPGVTMDKTLAITANATVPLPAGFAVKRIYARNTTANAVTGGLRIGTTNGGSEILGATALAGNTIVEAAPAASGLSASAQTLYVQAVTAWNSASVDLSIEMAPVFN